MYISAPVIVLYLAILAAWAVTAHKISQFVVEGYGVGAGVVFLIALFAFGRYLSERFDL